MNEKKTKLKEYLNVCNCNSWYYYDTNLPLQSEPQWPYKHFIFDVSFNNNGTTVDLSQVNMDYLSSIDFELIPVEENEINDLLKKNYSDNQV